MKTPNEVVRYFFSFPFSRTKCVSQNLMSRICFFYAAFLMFMQLIWEVRKISCQSVNSSFIYATIYFMACLGSTKESPNLQKRSSRGMVSIWRQILRSWRCLIRILPWPILQQERSLFLMGWLFGQLELEPVPSLWISWSKLVRYVPFSIQEWNTHFSIPTCY